MTEQENKTWAIDVLTAALRKLESGELKAQSCHVSVDSGSITDSTGTTAPFPNGIVTYTLTATDVKMARNFEIRGQAPGIKHVEQSIDKSELLDAEYLDDGGESEPYATTISTGQKFGRGGPERTVGVFGS